MIDVPPEMIWSAEQVTAEIGKHRDDSDWIPKELKEGGYIVTTFDGMLIKPPN